MVPIFIDSDSQGLPLFLTVPLIAGFVAFIVYVWIDEHR